MKKLFVLLILAGGAFKGYTDLYTRGSNAFDNNGQPQVLLFVHEGCGEPCADAVRLLNHRGVIYEEISVSDGEEQISRWEQFGSVRTMPYMVAGNEKVIGYNKWAMVSALALNFGNDYLTRSEEAIFRKNFHEDGQPKLVMYTMTGCGYCDLARSYFQQESIRFEERNTSVDYKAREELDKFQAGTPLIFYGYKRYVGWSDTIRRKILNEL